MPERSLNTRQVASMLASTSCGIGFLLGTGEIALRQGMIGCVYAVASALGRTMLIRALERRAIHLGFVRSTLRSIG